MVIQKPFLVPGRIEVGLLLASQNYQISFALIGDGCLLLRFLCGELGRQRRTRCQHREINQVSRYRQILKFPSSLRAVLNSFQHASISGQTFNLSWAPLNSEVQATVSLWQLEISAGALPPVSIAVPWSEGEANTWHLPNGRPQKMPL